MSKIKISDEILRKLELSEQTVKGQCENFSVNSDLL